eukprot:444189_1
MVKIIMITLMVTFTSLGVIDGFTTNVWPVYLNPDASIIKDVWTATTSIIGWIAGRELIVSSSFIYLLQCKCIANWIFENKPPWLIIVDIHIENNYLHYHIEWLAIQIVILIHYYIIDINFQYVQQMNIAIYFIINKNKLIIHVITNHNQLGMYH